jgi:dinuclear metal center YbgI/SA1388 family protein
VTITVQDCVDVLESAYPPSGAEDWDAVGLVAGDPIAPVQRVHLAVDPTPDVAGEALAAGAGLVVAHHPLFLRPVHGVAADTCGGRVVHDLVSAGAALFTAHTNADTAFPGVSDALADTLGLTGVTVLRPDPADLDLLVVYVPEPAAERLLSDLAAAGAGRLGAYERCAFLGPGTGTFRPLPGASPALGEVGRVERVNETRLEMALPRERRAAVEAALRACHPYEEPAFAVLESRATSGHGLGRVGDTAAPTTLRSFAALVRSALPATASGVRATADPDLVVRRVAVCGGAGLELGALARAAGADVLLTADARHHSALDAPLPVVDVSHWASEWPWLEQAAGLLRGALPGLHTSVSTLVTDPWRLHL